MTHKFGKLFRARPLAKGKAEGKAEGLAEGKAEGEYLAQIAIAKNLLAAGVDPQIVAKSTRLSLIDLSQLS